LILDGSVKVTIMKDMSKTMKTLVEMLADRDAKAAQGNWVPACNGTEVPFETRGRRLLYCWQPSTGRHAYLDLGTDLILSDADAALALGTC
jgi:hypothetical protein